MSSHITQKWKIFTLTSFFFSTLLVLFFNPSRPNGSVPLPSPSTTHKSIMVNPTPPDQPPLPAPSTQFSSFTGSSEGNGDGEGPTEMKKPIFADRTVEIHGGEKCNIFEGRWVYRADEKPSYNESGCPFLEQKMSCRRNGRPDLEYEKWSWEAKDCNIPQFDGKDMLERLRGKRVVIVGDSINRNQWESLVCLLYSSIPNSSEVEGYGVKSRVYKVFIAKDYNTTVEFHWSPFLVELDENHVSGSKVLKLDQIAASSERWLGADIMVFNTGHWWVHLGKLKTWDVHEYKGKLVENMQTEQAFKRAMKTWSNWIDQNVDPNKTAVFFRSISPEHKGREWCHNATQPISMENDDLELLFPSSMIGILENTVRETKNPVRYLNITRLSQYRRDAHPAVYRTYRWKMVVEKYKRLLHRFVDCSHWCLPGVPDTWNRLLYVSLFSPGFRED